MTKRVTQYAPHSSVVRSAASWPPQKAETLRFYVEAGMHSFTEIAAIMGITKNAAIGKAQRLGLDGPRMSGPRDAKEPSTVFERLDALHAKLDAILAAPRPRPVAAAKATDNATRPTQRARA